MLLTEYWFETKYIRENGELSDRDGVVQNVVPLEEQTLTGTQIKWVLLFKSTILEQMSGIP